ncbi:MAG TPA: DsbC family protein [Desulfuromonadaceae bacterium]
MLKEILVALAVTVIISSPSFAMAKEGCGGDCMICHKLTEKEAAELLKNTGITVKSVKPSPANGLFEILLEKEGKQGLLFMDYGKKHLIQGMMVALPDFKPVAAHMQDLPQPPPVTSIDPKTIPTENAIVMGNPKGSKTLYVFTDPDCPYCRKMHAELRQLEKIAPDVAIHIMLFPLPMHPAAYDKARAILAAKSRKLLDEGFEGKELPKPEGNAGKAGVDKVIAFANSHGISGTPTLIMPDGKVVVGGMDAESLKRMLDGK